MPEDPQHPMEAPLRAWAETRRQQIGAAFELHPADRRALQAEVRQVYANPPAATSHPLSWRALLARLTLAGALGGVLLFAVLQLTPSRPESPLELAKLDERLEPTPASEPTAPPSAFRAEKDTLPLPAVDPATESITPQRPKSAPPAAAPAAPVATEGARPQATRALTERYGIAVASSPAPTDSLATPQGPPEPSPTSALEVGAAVPAQPSPIPVRPIEVAEDRTDTAALQLAEPENRRLASRVSTDQAPELSTLPSPVPVTAAGAGRAESFRPAETPSWTANFQQAVQMRRNFNAPPEVALQNFRLEQTGGNLRVVDEDGSVYLGQLTDGGATTVAPTAGRGTSSFDFLVTGTNRTAQAPLVFQGNYTTGQASRVQGHAILGGRNRLVIDAVSTEPPR